MNYASTISTVTRLLRDYGQTVTWCCVSQPPPTDPDKPWESPAVTTMEYPVSLVTFPMPTYQPRTEFVEKGSETVKSLRIGYIAPTLPITPSVKDYIKQGANILQVVAITALAPAGVPLLYKMELSS